MYLDYGVPSSEGYLDGLYDMRFLYASSASLSFSTSFSSYTVVNSVFYFLQHTISTSTSSMTSRANTMDPITTISSVKFNPPNPVPACSSYSASSPVSSSFPSLRALSIAVGLDTTYPFQGSCVPTLAIFPDAIV